MNKQLRSIAGAILRRTYDDLRSPHLRATKARNLCYPSPRDKQDALNWIQRRNDPGGFSFETCCQLIGWKPSQVREVMLANYIPPAEPTPKKTLVYRERAELALANGG